MLGQDGAAAAREAEPAASAARLRDSVGPGERDEHAGADIACVILADDRPGRGSVAPPI